MSVAPASPDLANGDELVLDLTRWIEGRHGSSNNTRLRSDLQRYLQRRLRRPGSPADSLTVDRAGGARGPDFVIGDSVAIVILETLTDGSNRWLYREFGIVGQQFDSVIVVGHGLPEEHVDVWRTLRRRMTKRSPSTFKFVTTEQVWRSKNAEGVDLRSIATIVGLGMALLVWFSIAAYVFGAGSTVNPEVGTFVGAISVFLALVSLYCVYFVRCF